MGRRSITGTKAGKFMNPTDQARKEARRKELKKNKKQRLQVRQAVIKQKDPKHIFAEMEAIDKMEYDTNNPPPYSVKVLQDKRRKLKETWLKIYQFYQREDPSQAHTIKRMEQEYEQRRMSMMTIYESVMQAQRVKLDDIPLPEFCMPPDTGDIELPPSMADIQVLGDTAKAPKSILKSKPVLVSSCYDTEKLPPGPPSGSPPSLSEFECTTDEFELGLTIDESFKSQDKPKKIRFENNQPMPPQMPPQIAGQLPPPPPVTAATIQQSLLSKTYSSLNRVPPPPAAGYASRNAPSAPGQGRNQQGQQFNQAAGKGAEPKQAVQIQAQPVLRNKMAEVTRFVPTALTVKRDTKKPAPTSQSFVPSQVMSNQQAGGPYNYMLQQQQQYATLNPLSSYKSALSGSSKQAPLASSMTKLASNMSTSQSISIEAAPSVQRVDNDKKDDAYNKFMKEMAGLL